MQLQTKSPHWLLACLACALICCIRIATAFRVGIDFSQLPSSMYTNQDAWQFGRNRVDVIHALGPNHPTDPLSTEQRLALIKQFKYKAKIVITTWDTLMGQRVNNVNVATFDEYVYQRFRGGMSGGSTGGPKADIHVWDVNSVYGTGTATIEHLDYLQSKGFPQICILVRKWGKDGGYKFQDQIKAAILHPMTKCIITEGSPAAMSFAEHGGPGNTNYRLQVAKFVASTGKPYYILNPPGWDENRFNLTHIERIRYMVQDLTTTLGKDFMCSDKMTIIAAAYPVPLPKLDFLPERNPDGSFANTFAGGLAYLNAIKNADCPGTAPAPAPTLPLRPLVHPDVCMVQCKDTRFAACDVSCVRGSAKCLCNCRKRAVDHCSMKCRFMPPNTPYDSKYCNVPP